MRYACSKFFPCFSSLLPQYSLCQYYFFLSMLIYLCICIFHEPKIIHWVRKQHIILRWNARESGCESGSWWTAGGTVVCVTCVVVGQQHSPVGLFLPLSPSLSRLLSCFPHLLQVLPPCHRPLPLLLLCFWVFHGWNTLAGGRSVGKNVKLQSKTWQLRDTALPSDCLGVTDWLKARASVYPHTAKEDKMASPTREETRNMSFTVGRIGVIFATCAV